MADLSHSHIQKSGTFLGKIDFAWLVSAAILIALAILDTPRLIPTVSFTLGALAHTAPFIIFAILSIGYLKATGSEAVVAKVFQGRETQMIFFAAALGGIAPFCSCEVIPFIAALLAMGVPLSAVMAFWLASPLMDPAMFLITAGTLGFDFAIAKTISAVGMGLLGGIIVMTFSRTVLFANPLRANGATACGSCCDSSSPFETEVQWAFWISNERRQLFSEAVKTNGLFLLKWLTLAYQIEALMIHYVPADLIAGVLGGTGAGPIVLGALVGAPAYLNGYAAVPLVAGMLEQGMSNGAAMSFVLAGGVSCIPAAIAVWALVKPRVFIAYLSIAFVGSILAGLIWNILA